MTDATSASLPRAYSPAQVAQRYGVSPDKVRAWIASGELRAINISARRSSRKPRWAITPEALEAFEQQRAAAPPPRRQRRRRKRSGVTQYF